MNEIKLLALAFAIGVGTVINSGSVKSYNWDIDEELELEILQDQVSEDAEFLEAYLYEDTTLANDSKELEEFETYLSDNYNNYLALDLFADVTVLETETIVCSGK